jgi:hypothetical protein
MAVEPTFRMFHQLNLKENSKHKTREQINSIISVRVATHGIVVLCCTVEPRVARVLESQVEILDRPN